MTTAMSDTLNPGNTRNEVRVVAHRAVQIATVARGRKWPGTARTRRRNNHELQGMRSATKHLAAVSKGPSWHESVDDAKHWIVFLRAIYCGKDIPLAYICTDHTHLP
ncbi:hypothetical protein QCA50_014863 [Cerrena zonata]|uniref:Transposase n=1 Tax=Cerrena zonata TaxID=2478898 RepID=A0AAW0FX00_9APHY